MKVAYDVIADDDKSYLMSRVEEALRSGWVLQGGVSITSWGDGTDLRLYYAQALIYEEKDHQ